MADDADTRSDEKSTMRAVAGKFHRDNAQKRRNEEGEQLRMREMMIPKKQRRVYHKIRRGQKKQRREVRMLSINVDWGFVHEYITDCRVSE